ncbi:hypothetical protein MRY87_00565 [bacterium]|nr:hypothetical protein [bacterium]
MNEVPSKQKQERSFERFNATGIRFQTVAAVALGTLTGLLIALPLSPSPGGTDAPSLFGMLVLPASAAAGALIGYRRRESRAFLYFCFAAILLLSGTLSTSLEPTSAPQETLSQ